MSLSEEKSFLKWQVLLVTGLAVLLSLMTWFSATAILPELSKHLSLTQAEAGWLTNAVQLGFALGALASSLFALADVWPLTRFIAAAAVLAGLANLILLFDVGPMGVIIARFFTGVALAGIYPPAMKFIATWFQTGRGFAMGAMVGALTLGSAMPHLVRALGQNIEWQTVIWVCSFGSFIAALIFLFLLREGPYPFARTKVDLSQFAVVLRNRGVLWANIGYFGHMWELYALWGWFLAYVSSAAYTGGHSLNPSILTFLMIATGTFGCLTGGWLSERIGRCYTTMLMMGVSASCALLIGVFFTGPSWLFITIALIWGFSVIGDSAQFSAAVSELSDPQLVGSSLAFQMGIGFALTILVIWLTPLVADLLGSWRWTFLILVPGPMIGFYAMWRLRGMPEAKAMAGGRR